jgi:hypothetical protein
MSERQIDDAIDRAVRDLMDVDADSAFRARVVERLRKPKARTPFWRPLSIVSGAAGIAFLALVMTRENGKPLLEAPPATATSALTPRPEVQPAAVEPPAPRAQRPAAVPTARQPRINSTQQISRGTLVATVADDAGEPPLPAGVEPLNDIIPIEPAPIAPAPIVTTEITIAPIPPPVELVIVPLAPPIERE